MLFAFEPDGDTYGKSGVAANAPLCLTSHLARQDRFKGLWVVG